MNWMRSSETRPPEFHISMSESYAPIRGTRTPSIKSGSASPTLGSPIFGSPRLPQHGATSQEGAPTPSFQQTMQSPVQSADLLSELDPFNSSLNILAGTSPDPNSVPPAQVQIASLTRELESLRAAAAEAGIYVPNLHKNESIGRSAAATFETDPRGVSQDLTTSIRSPREYEMRTQVVTNVVGVSVGAGTVKLGELVVPLTDQHFGDAWRSLHHTPTGRVHLIITPRYLDRRAFPEPAKSQRRQGDKGGSKA